ncbi:MAG TPA: dTDP-4-dehydrorhamnose reductase [Polyangiales bacterium]|nr:dTDP-4-dehydrorhamnose reductase [Polyangiales bacterium]
MARMTTAYEPLLIVGASGMLARAFAAELARAQLRYDALDLPELDITDRASVAAAIGEPYRTVINCAAYTDVDGAQANPALADAVNGRGVGHLAERCAATGAKLVHFGTDYVFDGSGRAPYPVDHPRSPLGAYGHSKALGEELLAASGADHLLIRTSWLYAPWGKNFVLTMRNLVLTRERVQVVDDQRGRPTSAEYLAERTLALIARQARGVFHVTDGGECTWHELARAIAELSSARCEVAAFSTKELGRPAPRPAYSVLALDRVEALLGPSTPWRENLARVLAAAAASGAGA